MTERELNRVRELNGRLKSEEGKLLLLRETASRLGPQYDGQPRTRRLTDRLSDLVASIIDKSRELENLREELKKAKAELTEKLCASKLSGREIAVMHRRYVRCMTFRDICFELDYSDAHIFYLHRRALRKLIVE